MKQIRVNYVISKKTPKGIDCDRSPECFPLEVGTYRLKKHPEITVEITKVDRENWWFILNNNGDETKLPHGAYTWIELDNDPKREVTIYLESEAEPGDFPPEVEPLSLPEIKGATLLIKVDYYDRDTYSGTNSTYEETLPVVHKANMMLKWYDQVIRVKRIISNHEVVIGIGPKGDEFTVTDKEDGTYQDGGTYGYNDNWRSFSVKITVKLIKK